MGAALGLLEAEGHVGAVLLGPYYEGVLLLLVAVVLANARLEQLARLVILRDDDNLGVFLLRRVSAWSETPIDSDFDLRSPQRPCKSRCLGQTSHCS
jgi:hypothetical protein